VTDEQEFDQKAATYYSVARFLDEGNLPEGSAIELEVFFMPEAEADQPAFLKALKTFGYEAEVKPGQTDAGPRAAVLVTVPTKMTADDIWLHEARTTKLARARGYAPDGWGFLEPDP